MEQRLVAQWRPFGSAELEADREELDDALERRRGRRRARPGSRPAGSRARRARSPAATIPAARCRPAHSPCRPRTRRGRAGRCGRSPATISVRLPTRAWRSTAWSGESGLVDGDRVAGRGDLAVGRPAGVATSGTGRPGRGATSAWVTTSVRPAPTSVSRIASRTSSGLGRQARHRRVRQRRSGSARSRGSGRSPRSRSASISRSRRQVGTVATIDLVRRRRSTASGCGPAATATCVPAGVAGSVSTPTRARSARCSSAARSCPSRRSTRAGPERDRALGGLAGCAVDPAARHAPPAHSTMSRAARSAPMPREPGLLALLEAEAGLGPERVARPVRRMLTGSKIADSTMTSVVAGADLRGRRRP